MTITDGLGQYAAAALGIIGQAGAGAALAWATTYNGTYTDFTDYDQAVFKKTTTDEGFSGGAEKTTARAMLTTNLDAAALTVDHFVRVGGVGGTIYAVTEVEGEHLRRYALARRSPQAYGVDRGDA